jgi:hypothetical protein
MSRVDRSVPEHPHRPVTLNTVYGPRWYMYHHAEVAHCRKKSMTIHFFSIDMSSIPISFIPVRVRRQLRGVRRAVNLRSLIWGYLVSEYVRRERSDG